MGPLRTIGFDEHTNTCIIRDTQSIVHALVHTQQPFAADGPTALDAAENYLRKHAELLGLDQSELRALRVRPQDNPSDDGVEYRFFSEKRQFDVTTITFQQTHSGLPVWNAGVSVHLKDEPVRYNWLRDTPDSDLRFVMSSARGKSRRFHVVCAQTTGHPAPAAARFRLSLETFTRLRALDERILAEQLGIAGKQTLFDTESLRIKHRHLMIHRYEDASRTRTVPTSTDVDDENTGSLAIPLPAVSAQIANTGHYPVAALYFDLTAKGLGPFHWVALVEATTLSVLYLEVFAGGINCKVFSADPATTNGGPPPSADNAQLNQLRLSMPLLGLRPPHDPQALAGDNVVISDFSQPMGGAFRPPTEPANVDFDFDVRSNEFAAVNAYYNCDRFFRLVEELGFKRDDYFPGTKFPTPVDHRGTHSPLTGGREVDAQSKGTTTVGPDGAVIGGILQTLFCLADVSGPPDVGIACDWRVVLHELGGHGTLNNHVNSSYFGFAHSAGDSFAAILNDPESRASDKGHTFPWAFFDRRHNRTTEAGWGWDGTIDLNDVGIGVGQKREQILTSTHFRLYQSIGGGSPLVDARRFAARFTIYLILRAIQSLTPITNPQHASDWLCNLLVADSADWTSESHGGGAYEKVICWAFEKQYLFGGTAPDVDVYIDDGRGGEYQYQPDHASCPAIWNRRTNDRDETHQPPLPNHINYAYVKIKNRGTQTAKSVVVNAFQSSPQSALVYPDDWQSMQTPQLSAADLPRSHEATVGPFAWVPTSGENAILVAVSANGDPSNLRKFATGRPIPDWRLVPNDNNLGMRKV